MSLRPLRVHSVAVFLILTTAGDVYGQETFSGVLDPELITSDSPGTPIVCNRMGVNDVPMTAGSNVFGCVASWFSRNGQLRIPMRLVEQEGSEYPHIFVDVDQNGVFSAHERFDFVKRRQRYARAEVRFTIPTPGSAFPQFPVVLLIPKERLNPPLPDITEDERYLFQSIFLFATARVVIDGQTIYFRYSVYADSPGIDLRGNVQAVDLGTLDENPLTPFRVASRHEAPIFRIGTRYVSTQRVDLHQRAVVIRTRDPSEYRRLELRRGLALPDFAFVDLDGNTRHLSEFRGRHVLLYFWYRGCTPCEDALSEVRSASNHFRSEKLAIVGLMDDNTPADVLRPLVAPMGPFDAHAAPWSVWTLIHEWFAIGTRPTLILLDQQGRIVSINQQYDGRDPLRGPSLLKTLRSVIPRG